MHYFENDEKHYFQIKSFFLNFYSILVQTNGEADCQHDTSGTNWQGFAASKAHGLCPPGMSQPACSTQEQQMNAHSQDGFRTAKQDLCYAKHRANPCADHFAGDQMIGHLVPK